MGHHASFTQVIAVTAFWINILRVITPCVHMGRPLYLWNFGVKVHMTPLNKSHGVHKLRVVFGVVYHSSSVVMASSAKRTTPYQSHHGLQFGVRVAQRSPHHLATVQQSFPPNACFAYTLDARKRLDPNEDGLRTSSTSSRPFVQTSTSNIIAISMRNVGRSIRPQMTLVRRPSLKASWRSRRQCTATSARSRSRRFFLSTRPSSMLLLVKLWDPEDVEGQTHANMMACFQDVADERESLQDGHGKNAFVSL